MIHFFQSEHADRVYVVEGPERLSAADTEKLSWLFGNASPVEGDVSGVFIGPRTAMVSPWSTNAVEITQNMGVSGITRIEEFTRGDNGAFDPMLSQKFNRLDQDIFTIDIQPEPIHEIDDIAVYNKREGLALSGEEIDYLEKLSVKIGRKLTDSEVFGFSQVNSEHCRHKIFNGTFVIDGQSMPESLFALIKKTTAENPNAVVSAYKDNVAFISGPSVRQFAPRSTDGPGVYEKKKFDSVISLKAETHNFPTTVEPFNGAATGTGGEIRDRLAGGQGSLPLAGTAVYMTPYARLDGDRPWEKNIPPRKWLYQTPLDILIKASNGASDFGNKFGQPLICGSLLTFEHEEGGKTTAYDKVVMLAGGVGYGKREQSAKHIPGPGDDIVVMGGDNYRIGMGGAAVSSADTGASAGALELNAVQRSNPEMQKRVANAIRSLVESGRNPITSIHDHGAGGHLNCLSELVEETGGKIDMDKLPVGDPTLSAREIIGNESQERMGLVIPEKDLETLKRIAERERAPLYTVGKVTGDRRFTFVSISKGDKPMDLDLSALFGSSPKTVMRDKNLPTDFADISYEKDKLETYLGQVLQLEAVACKDWLTNKVDRCVGGRVAKQQCAGPLQLPLNNCGVTALDFEGKEGVATSIGHAPISGLIDPAAGSRNSIAEALTNIVWAPIKDGLQGVTLSANWMWPCKNPGEDARLYQAVQACSDFALQLGINIPTGKDSLSLTQKYPDGDQVPSPGTVIISAAAHCDNIRRVVEPVLQRDGGNLYYIDLSGSGYELGGSSFAQSRNALGSKTPDIDDAGAFKRAFEALQELIKAGKITAGHDVGSGGLITTLLEMCFAEVNLGARIDLTELGEADTVKLFFSENAGLVFQASEGVEDALKLHNVAYYRIGKPEEGDRLTLTNGDDHYSLSVSGLRDTWYKTSYLLDCEQSGAELAEERYQNYKNQPLAFRFPTGNPQPAISPAAGQPATDNRQPIAAILREKGSNSEREMAHALWLAGFEVRDVHMTDLMTGRETLEDVQFLGVVGGFSNSDVLGSAKGWAGTFRYNDRARTVLENFFAREDTLSLGVCNGCQLFIELGLIHPGHGEKPRMLYNRSGKFECVFSTVDIQPNPSVMLGPMAGARLGIWSAHGEGRFHLPYEESRYQIAAKYSYDGYPASPNGSDYNAAMIVSDCGRHLVTMPHFERSLFSWNWAHYPVDRKDDTASPWLAAFINAREWVE